jgi:hypothetical protein
MFSHVDWDGTTTISYGVAEPIPTPISYSIMGMSMEATVGISMFSMNRNLNYDPSYFYDTINWQGYVIGLDSGTYAYLCPDGVGDVSEHLPSGIFGNGWDIEPVHYNLVKPIASYESGYDPKLGEHRDKFNSHESPGSTGSSQTMRFNFVWDEDAAEGDAKVTLQYRPPLYRESPIGSYTEKIEPNDPPQGPYPGDMWSPYQRHGYFQEIVLQSGQPWASSQSDAEHALWSSVDLTWKTDNRATFERVKAVSGVAGLIPHLKVAATFVGAFTDFYAKFEPKPQLVHVTRKYWCMQKAFNMGGGWINPIPANCPSEQELSMYKWKDFRRQLYIVRVFADDVYSGEGYVRQSLGFEYDIGAGYDERQAFTIDTGTGGGGQ